MRSKEKRIKRKTENKINKAKEIIFRLFENNFLSNEDIMFLRDWYSWDYRYIRKNMKENNDSDEFMFFNIIMMFFNKKNLNDIELTKIVNTFYGNSFEEKVYNFLYPNNFKTCINGNKYKFGTVTTGYNRSCKTRCKCVLQKQEESNLKKYGVKNVAQSKEIQDKIKQTNLEKYGTENVFSSKEIKDKIKKTNIKKYGVETTASVPEIRQKQKETLIKKYGVDCGFKSKKIKNKIKQTNLERYGVDNIFKKQEVQDKIKQTNLEKYGTENVFSSKEIKDKIKKYYQNNFNVDHYRQKHFINYSLLKDKNFLLKEYDDCNSLNSLALKIGCSTSTLKKYLIQYNPKLFDKVRSSYEKEISSFLDKFKINYILNSRSIIEKMELDFFLPDYNIGIELNGVYWHSDKIKDNNYHQEKWKKCFDKNIKLLSLNEDILVRRMNIVKDYILDLINPKLFDISKIKEISEEEFKKFLEEKTIHYFIKCEKYYGIFDIHDNLISVLSVSNNICKLIHISSVLDKNILFLIENNFPNLTFTLNLDSVEYVYLMNNEYYINQIKNPDYRLCKNDITYSKESNVKGNLYKIYNTGFIDLKKKT